MKDLAEGLAYLVGAVATIVAIGMFLMFFAFVLVFMTGVAVLAGIVILIFHLCGVDVREEISKRV